MFIKGGFMRCPRCGRTLTKIPFGDNIYYFCQGCGWGTKASRKIEEEFGPFD